VKARHAAAFSLALLAAMAVLAVAYGLWSKTLTVGGTVHTGDLDLNWTFTGCSEHWGWPGPFHEGEYLGKDVGSVSAEIDQDDPEIVHFTVSNGYPSYVADCQLEYTNVGTIPVNIIATTIIPGPNLTNCHLTGGQTSQTKTLSCDQLTVVFVDGIGMQLDPGDTTADSLRIHVEQLAKEQTDYTFTVLSCAAQWNESPTIDECLAAAGNSEP